MLMRIPLMLIKQRQAHRRFDKKGETMKSILSIAVALLVLAVASACSQGGSSGSPESTLSSADCQQQNNAAAFAALIPAK